MCNVYVLYECMIHTRVGPIGIEVQEGANKDRAHCFIIFFVFWPSLFFSFFFCPSLFFFFSAQYNLFTTLDLRMICRVLVFFGPVWFFFFFFWSSLFFFSGPIQPFHYSGSENDLPFISDIKYLPVVTLLMALDWSSKWKIHFKKIHLKTFEQCPFEDLPFKTTLINNTLLKTHFSKNTFKKLTLKIHYYLAVDPRQTELIQEMNYTF